MAFISKFCFSCSTRFGSVVIGIATLIQGSLLLGVTITGVETLTTDTLNKWGDDLQIKNDFYREVAQNPKLIVVLLATFFSCLIFSSILLIYGCFQCKTYLMYPFLIFYLMYIVGLFVGFLLLIFYVKVKGNGLGDLILVSNLGGFILLFYVYSWVCVVSLVQIINELQKRLRQKLQVVENLKRTDGLKLFSKNKTKGFHNHAHFN